MGFISALVLFESESFVGCVHQTLINTALVNSDPKIAWVYPNGYGYYQLTMSDPKLGSALTGVWITEGGLEGKLIDGTLADVQAKLSAGTGTITPVYNGTYPPIVDPTAATYTFTRVDDGTVSDAADFELAYLKWIIPGTFQRSSYSSPTSTYVFNSLTDPTPQGNDVLTNESARVFLSNAGGALTTGNKWTIVGYINGSQIAPAIVGATNGALSTIVTALTADAVYGPLGTWSVSGTSIQLSTTTVDDVNLTLTQGT